MRFAGWLAVREPTAGGDFHPAPKTMDRSIAPIVAGDMVTVNRGLSRREARGSAE
jgi:hypothetical protein